MWINTHSGYYNKTRPFPRCLHGAMSTLTFLCISQSSSNPNIRVLFLFFRLNVDLFVCDEIIFYGGWNARKCPVSTFVTITKIWENKAPNKWFYLSRFWITTLRPIWATLIARLYHLLYYIHVVIFNIWLLWHPIGQWLCNNLNVF